jgi:hypothetical protein
MSRTKTPQSGYDSNFEAELCLAVRAELDDKSAIRRDRKRIMTSLFETSVLREAGTAAEAPE